MPDALPRAERQEHAARVRALMANKHEAFLREQSALPGAGLSRLLGLVNLSNT